MTEANIETSNCVLRFTQLKQAAKMFFGPFGLWAYDTWQELNDIEFEGLNKVGPIHWGLTPHGRALGFYRPFDNSITLHTSLVEPRSAAPWQIERLGKPFAREVLLHEMMHQRVHQRCGQIRYGGRSCHNTTEWVNEVNRLLDKWGHVGRRAIVITQKRVNGKPSRDWVAAAGFLTQQELSHFPHWLSNTQLHVTPFK